jgi:hypothetical protein
MRLIRLQSGVLSTSIFTTNLSVALNCKEKTSVALKNLTIQFPEPSIDVDLTNNIFSFKTGVTSIVDLSIQVVIPVGQYTVNTLTETLTLLMNNNLYTYGNDNNTELTGTHNLNFEWLVSATGNISDGYVMNLAFNRTDEITLSGTSVGLTGMIEDPGTTGEFYKNIPNDSGKYNAELISNSLICRGGWEISMNVGAQVSGQVENIADSFWFFYIAKNGKTKTETFYENIIDSMSVGFWGTDGRYEYKKGGVMVQTGIEIQAGDNLKIAKNKDGKILYIITQEGIPIPLEGDVVNDLADDLGTADLNYFIKVGNDTGKIAFSECLLTPSPNQTNLAGVLTKDKLVQNIKQDFNLTAGASDVSLFFPSLGVRFLLGFNNQNYEENALSSNFTGENTVASTIFNNDMIIEILEFPLLAYDGGTQKVRPILDVITSGEVQSSIKGKGSETYELSYSSIAPTFLDFNISQGTQTYSSLTLRITSNNQQLRLNGVITASILINDL